MSDNKRYMLLGDSISPRRPEITHGRYTADNPENAAKKAFIGICRVHNEALSNGDSKVHSKECTYRFSIKEVGSGDVYRYEMSRKGL